MAARGHGSLGVVDGRELIGLVTERDIVTAVGRGANVDDAKVSTVMSRDPDVFSPDFDVREAAEWLAESSYRHLPVVENSDLLGIVSVRDVLIALVNLRDQG